MGQINIMHSRVTAERHGDLYRNFDNSA